MIVEDGTGVPNADSYITVQFADEYFTDRGNAAWVGTEAVKTAAIIRATDFIETRWGLRFLGRRQFPQQSLSFPRVHLYTRDGCPVTGIPLNLKKATAEYAVRALSGELMPDPTIDATGRQVVSKREKIGPIEEETSYVANMTLLMTDKPYPAADKLLAEYVSSGNGRVYR